MYCGRNGNESRKCEYNQNICEKHDYNERTDKNNNVKIDL
jgi:hypothetical protein